MTEKSHAARERAAAPTTSSRRQATNTLAIDIGGTGLKAAVVDGNGKMLGKRRRIDTPQPAPPSVLVEALVGLVAPLKAYQRVSIGFPGVVRDGLVLTAPHFGTEAWYHFPLAATLAERLGKPARLLNDAEVQGYGAIRGDGLEFVITLGTGFGTALFRDGQLMPHMEFAQFEIRKHKTLNEYVGNAVLRKIGETRWNRRVAVVVAAFRTLLNFDRLYIGGGNARKVQGDLPDDVVIVSNDTGLTGGVRLWEPPVGQPAD